MEKKIFKRGPIWSFNFLNYSTDIMDDAHQVLYQPCALGGHACGKPTPGVGGMAFCTTHTQLTELKKRYPPEEPHVEEQVNFTSTLVSNVKLFEG